jgi:ADP-ribose pyrophosphatase YjhB (NUDIX family)
VKAKAICLCVGIWLLRRLQRILGASTVGVRALILDQQRRILLVKHTYMPGWHLPGGGVSSGETAIAAIIREVREEAGVIVNEIPRLFNVYFHKVQGVNDYPILFIITQFTLEQSRCCEIAETGWFAFDSLPEDTSQSTCKRLDEFFQNQNQNPNVYW